MKRVTLTAFGVLAAFAASCGSPQLTAENVDATLSALLLRPDVTCDQLRAGFDLYYLPIVSDPLDAGIGAYEETWIASGDDGLVHTWYIPTKLDRGTVIVSMGAPGDASCYLFAARTLARNGWSVVLFDYPGFGLSTGRASLERLPTALEDVLNWTLSRTGRPAVTLHGISIGSLPVVALAAKRPEAVNGVVLDSPVALGESLERLNGMLAGTPLAAVALLPPELRTEEVIRTVPQPMLVFAHTEDFLTPLESVRVLFERAPGPKVLKVFEGLEHARGMYLATDEFIATLEPFLTAVWNGDLIETHEK